MLALVRAARCQGRCQGLRIVLAVLFVPHDDGKTVAIPGYAPGRS